MQLDANYSHCSILILSLADPRGRIILQAHVNCKTFAQTQTILLKKFAVLRSSPLRKPKCIEHQGCAK